jgi:hypothetical protein
MVAGAPAVLLLVAAFLPAWRMLRATVLIVGAASMVVAGAPLLGLRPIAEVHRAGPVWPEAVDHGRVYVPTPAEDVMPWLASSIEARRLWPVGYLNLRDGLALARTDAPVANDRLASHIAITDEGPTKRWWLDALAADWLVLPESAGVPGSMEEVAARGGMRLLRNRRALPVVSLAAHRPDPDRLLESMGEVSHLELIGNTCSATITAPSDGWAWISLAPVTGWRWRLDGRPVRLEKGPGIIQYLELSAGDHQLKGQYLPPGHLLTTILSGCATLVVLLGLARHRWCA